MKKNKFLTCTLSLVVALLAGLSACTGGGAADTISVEVNKPATGSLESVSPDIALPQTPQTPSQPESWVPDIIVDETGKGVPDIDDSTVYDYSAQKLTFKVASGSFNEAAASNKISTYTTTGTNNLLYTTSVAFPYGTLTCSVKTTTTADSGVVFGLTTPQENFWEGSGISYYFFFLSREGTAYLGKTDHGSWYILKQVPYSFNDADTYTLKVVYQGSKICCYVNGEFMLGVRDISPLSGTAFGVRSGASNVVFSNMSITNAYNY